jgi:hypothetical protein
MIKSLIFKVVLPILTIYLVVAFAGQSLFRVCNTSFEIRAKTHMNSLGQAVEMYKYDHGNYPDSLEILSKEYIGYIPEDPWGNKYVYMKTEEAVEIYTYGDPSKKESINHVVYKEI